jgi:hypothetical protein
LPVWGFSDSDLSFDQQGNDPMSDTEYTRRQAEEAHRRDQQSQMATEQAIRDATAREAYNAELARQRQLDEERRRNQT